MCKRSAHLAHARTAQSGVKVLFVSIVLLCNIFITLLYATVILFCSKYFGIYYILISKVRYCGSAAYIIIMI